MPRILTQKQLRRAKLLPFCYLCGRSFSPSDPATDDHVPPTSFFAKKDRDTPLILPAHYSCNTAQSRDDERTGQMLALMHGRSPPEGNQLIEAVVVTDTSSGITVGGIRKVNLERSIVRCLRAFHAALYQQFLADHPESFFSLSLAIPSGPLTESGEIRFDEIPQIHRPIVRKIRENRLAGKLDRIECRRGECRYDCVWDRLDDGRPACLFALDIYDLRDFGATGVTTPRGCVGIYCPPNGFPPDGTRRSFLELGHIRMEEFNPFD